MRRRAGSTKWRESSPLRRLCHRESSSGIRTRKIGVRRRRRLQSTFVLRWREEAMKTILLLRPVAGSRLPSSSTIPPSAVLWRLHRSPMFPNTPSTISTRTTSPTASGRPALMDFLSSGPTRRNSTSSPPLRSWESAPQHSLNVLPYPTSSL
ncbi:hypothetical protein BCR35DRAFT_50986 [Leucosporidium creatinivorum]|uniref:Uncharacterized protein n=1 Tax=Leucosporidium creatinivorum TaxID=106004 RepID=A0A1Y2FQ53_9BASI|nr:hypothetical protein BCR35DRAFT_50986 [Leucosporidium creatinivorum]